MDRYAYDTYLVSGNITIFCGQHPENFKSDILNSALLAELASTSKHPATREKAWSEYTGFLSNTGWITKSREFNRYDFTKQRLFRIIESGSGLLLTNDEKQNVLNSFLQLKQQLSQSPVIKIILDKLQANAFAPSDEVSTVNLRNTSGATSMQLTIVLHNANIITLQLAFKMNKVINIDILDEPVLNSISDRKSNMWLLVSALDTHRYDKIREAVIKKLGNRINTELLHIPVVHSKI